MIKDYKQITTIKIYSEDLNWGKLCCKVKLKNSCDCFKEFRNIVKLKKQSEFYNSLPMPSDYKRKLDGKRLNINKINKKYTK